MEINSNGPGLDSGFGEYWTSTDDGAGNFWTIYLYKSNHPLENHVHISNEGNNNYYIKIRCKKSN